MGERIRTHRQFIVGATLCIATAMPLTGCGDSDSEGNAPAAQSGANAEQGGGQQPGRQGGPGGFAQDPKVASCLRKQGVRLPNRGRSQQGKGTAPQGPPPDGQARGGQPPTGGPPGGARRGNPEQFKKLQSALKKCGAQLPAPPQGGGAPPDGAPPMDQQQQQSVPGSGRELTPA